MMRSRFDEQLDRLNIELVEMGGLIEQCIERASRALIERDVLLAKSVRDHDDTVDEKERQIESLCLKLLLQQQPVARDLRQISAALKMITDMERIGDQAADIAEIVVMLDDTPFIKRIEHIPAMADATIRMVHDSIDAYVQRDLSLARQVVASDDVVDDLFLVIRKELIERITNDPDSGEQAMDLLMVAKYLERIGDHATNIAEWVEFSMTGVHHSVEAP